MTIELPRLKSYSRMKEVMTMYYMGAKMAEGSGQKMAWITSGAPVEFLYAADMTPLYPENHAAMCGASRLANTLCSAAEEAGFSRDLCSYARTDIGAILTGTSPIGGLPKPDLLVCCNNICGTVTKWYQELQRHFDVPLVLLDVPYQYEKEDAAHVVSYLKDQLKGYIGTIEEVTGKSFDYARFDEVVALSGEAADLWRSIQGMLAHKPAPMNSFDTFIHMAPIVTLRGTQLCLDYYRELEAELRERIEQGIGAVPVERFRLGWDNLAIWHQMNQLSRKFAEFDAALVVSTYTENFSYRGPIQDPDDHLLTYASTYIGGYINHGLDFREKELTRMVKDFSLDGFVMHSNRSCRAYSLGQYELARRMEEKHGVPTLMLEADMNDSRTWSDEQMNTRISAFMETLTGRCAVM